MDDFKNIPVVRPPGVPDDYWARIKERERSTAELEDLFPHSDAEDFIHACAYNDEGPWSVDNRIVDMVMTEQGCRDMGNWEWWLKFEDGSTWHLEAGCDYTGWECRSFTDWTDMTEWVTHGDR